ncbi:MAG: P1 family peptidase [Salinibacterium sp.]|nr:P1 family peptidase [Salinibacterium sp.]
MTRARDLGIPFGGIPGPRNALTDVPGVEVGMVDVVSDENGVSLRTGVTAILPLGRDRIGTSVAAGIYSLNGNGELTGSHWIHETGGVASPIMITNTHAVGTVHRGVVEWTARNRPELAAEWLLPVVGETWDGYLNSINVDAVTHDHVATAIDTASASGLREGSHGGGTGMNCYSFKGGNGTASRLVSFGGVDYTVGVFLQANFGDREELTVAGIPVGDLDMPNPMGDPSWLANDRGAAPGGAGSCIAIIATDAPLTPQQCEALARRAPLGLARTGTTGSHFSGDIVLALSTANAGELNSGFPSVSPEDAALRSLSFVPWNYLDPFYAAVVEGVEEATLNALINNETMIGRSGHTSPALPHDLLVERLATHGRLNP